MNRILGLVLLSLLWVTCVWGNPYLGLMSAGVTASGTSSISDDFSSDTSANYTAMVGGISIGSGVATGTQAASANFLYHETSLGSADQDVQATLAYPNYSESGCLIVRYDPTADDGYIVYFSGGRIYLAAFTNHAIDTATFNALYNGSYSYTTYVVRVIIKGTSIKVNVDGTERISATSATYSAGNYCGIGMNNDGSAGDATVDNLTGEVEP